VVWKQGMRLEELKQELLRSAVFRWHLVRVGHPPLSWAHFSDEITSLLFFLVVFTISCMFKFLVKTVIFLDFIRAYLDMMFLHGYVPCKNIVIFLELIRANLNTMYMRAREDLWNAQGRKWKRVYKERGEVGKKNKEEGYKVSFYYFLSHYI
jgi:hypothetical protein